MSDAAWSWKDPRADNSQLELRYEPGMVGMALSGKDTGGSQWFITHSPQPHLNGRYTIFARVVRGMEVVHAIVQGDAVWRVEIFD